MEDLKKYLDAVDELEKAVLWAMAVRDTTAQAGVENAELRALLEKYVVPPLDAPDALRNHPMQILPGKISSVRRDPPA